MSTGNFQDFLGNIAEIGPMYPFVGWEWLFTLLCFVFWIGWHSWQIRIESREFREEAENYISKEILERVNDREAADPDVY